MVKSAVADVVAGTVSADDPLTPGREIALQIQKLGADVAAAFLHQRNELVGNLPCHSRVVAVVEPLLEEGLDLIRAAAAGQTLGHEGCDGLTDAVGTEFHSESEFAEVLEQ